MILAVFEDVTQREKNIILGGAAGPSGIRIFQPPFDMDTKVVAWKKRGDIQSNHRNRKKVLNEKGHRFELYEKSEL